MTQTRRDKTKLVAAHPAARKAGRNTGLKRIDMIAAILKRHHGLSLHELIASLDKEFGWKATESNVTPPVQEPEEVRAHQTRSSRKSSNHLVFEVASGFDALANIPEFAARPATRRARAGRKAPKQRE